MRKKTYAVFVTFSTYELHFLTITKIRFNKYNDSVNQKTRSEP